MTGRDQLRRVCRWNRQLSRENRRLRQQLGQARQELAEQEEANAELRLEAEATNVLLGAAMDEALAGSERR
jgi:regulator of replication initiation timing